MERIDKILAHMGLGTRSEIKKYLKKGVLKVNGKVISDAAYKVNPEIDEIIFNEKPLKYRKYIYIMLNKPAGVVSATEDGRERTVIDLLDFSYRHFELFPMGRLDKDTEGLLIITNDGKFAHDVLSPKKHVPKKYFVKIEGFLDKEDVLAFNKGIVLDDGYRTLPAKLHILQSGDFSEAEVIIKEGKFHQIKRMFTALGKEVVYLKRIAMGGLYLDDRLKPGDYREITEQEKELILLKEE